MNLHGQVALVTGSSRRVGRAIALELAGQGCAVAVHGHTSRAHSQAVVDQIAAAGGRARLFMVDLADASSAEALPGRVAEQMGRLDILVNNAAVFHRVPLPRLDRAEWERTFAVNVFAVSELCKAAAPYLRQAAPGRIVNISDISARRPWANYMAYCASKGALENMTMALARALAPDVLVNAVAPGIAEFPVEMDEATRKRLIDKVPARRAGSAADVAGVVTFLVRDATYVTGTSIAVDGGREIAW